MSDGEKIRIRRIIIKKGVNNPLGGGVIKRVTLIRREASFGTVDIYFVRSMPKREKKECKNVTRDAVSWANDVIDGVIMPRVRQTPMWWARIITSALFALNIGLITGVLL